MEPAPDLTNEKIEAAVAELSDEFARRVGGLADLFDSWRRPEVARALIDSMISGDREAFGDLHSGLDLPILNICAWAREVVDVIVEASASARVCRLRTDLSPEERRATSRLPLPSGERRVAICCSARRVDVGRSVSGPRDPTGPLPQRPRPGRSCDVYGRGSRKRAGNGARAVDPSLRLGQSGIWVDPGGHGFTDSTVSPALPWSQHGASSVPPGATKRLLV